MGKRDISHVDRSDNEKRRRSKFSDRLSLLFESKYIMNENKKDSPTSDGRKHKHNNQGFLKDLEDRVGLIITESSFKAYRYGTRFPSSSDVIAGLADFFDVSVEYILGVSDKPNEINEKIQEMLPLTNDSIKSLKHGNDNAVLMINALLGDRSQTILQLLYNVIYDYYVLHNKNIVTAPDQSVPLYNSLLGSAMLLMASIPKALTPEMTASFDKMFENDTRNPKYQGEQDTVQQMSMEEAAEDDPFAPITIKGTVKES